MDNIYVSTRFGHGRRASGMWDLQHSQLLYGIAALVFICDFCLFSIHLQMDKKMSGKKIPAARLLFESVRW